MGTILLILGGINVAIDIGAVICGEAIATTLMPK